MARQIRKNLLPHEVTYKAYLPNTGEGASYSSEVVLYNVKVEEIKQTNYTNNGREIIGNALMFYDFKMSSGLVADPIINSEIIFNGRTYHISLIDTLRDNRNRPHHYEITLR